MRIRKVRTKIHARFAVWVHKKKTLVQDLQTLAAVWKSSRPMPIPAKQ